MFCPNCGTENEETATPCKKCGFKLRGVSAPKFKGTMLLNSDQAVQQLVQEARRRLEQGSSPDAGQPPLPHDGQSAAWANQAAGLRTLNGGLHPPRVTSPRVGRTMMGVAPQMGGYAPPSPGSDPGQPEPASSLGPVATAAASPEAAPTSASEISPASSEQTPQLEAGSPPSFRVDAVAANDCPGHWPGGTVNEALGSRQLADEGSSERVTTEVAIDQNAAPDMAAPAQGAGKLAHAADLPSRVHPLELVLVVLTLGLYGFVLWARKRTGKRAPASGS